MANFREDPQFEKHRASEEVIQWHAVWAPLVKISVTVHNYVSRR